MAKTETLASARDEVIEASVHAAAQLVLHAIGARRLGRADVKMYTEQLQLLITTARRPS